MTPEPFDPVRLWLGETPWFFLIEVALRMLFLYAALLITLRAMGRRMSSQLTRNELLALVSLAAGVGPALQDPQLGLLPPLIIAFWVAAMQRGIAFLSVRSRRFDRAANSHAELLVDQGRLLLDALRRNAVSREHLFAELRARGVLQLGCVERMYLEADGSFSLFLLPQACSGLSIVPTWDPALAARHEHDAQTFVCTRCGTRAEAETSSHSNCQYCHTHSWARAVRP